MLPGAFVAVPLYRVNKYPMGPHPAGSYESKSNYPLTVSLFALLWPMRVESDKLRVQSGYLTPPSPRCFSIWRQTEAT
jgi:hypothetical protein